MDVFERYAPLVQSFIYQQGWQEVRDVQAQAAEILFDGDENLLICSSTASGKTALPASAVFISIILSSNTQRAVSSNKVCPFDIKR